MTVGGKLFLLKNCRQRNGGHGVSFVFFLKRRRMAVIGNDG
jgi:hypothetical protein